MNKSKLKSYISLNNDTVKELSKALGITRYSYYKKLNGVTDWKLNEIKVIKSRYYLDMDKIEEIFFETN